MNTDVSTGRGSTRRHLRRLRGGGGRWSTSTRPGILRRPRHRWLEATAARLSGHRAAHPRGFGAGAATPIPLTDVRHQDSQTECGLYALYFIRRRLEGAPLAEFRGTRIPDSAMVKFRTHVFRADR